MSRKFQMRDRVKCNVTGFTGVVTGYCEYLNGCEQFCVKPTTLKKGEMQDGQWFDKGQLDLVLGKPTTLGELEKNLERTGGPQMDSPPPC